MIKIPELLAPAGGLEQLIAAVENGADAVYMGGKLFNARINADNFNDEELLEGVAYAHLRGAKLYVTMNTLLSDKELPEALDYAQWLYENGVDALILQELSLAQLIKKRIPDMDIHLSTQGTIYNIEGVKAAKKLGFSRVVLARELGLEEIKAITEEKLLDIEVFVHGALCICYSGQCQMSNEIGGRSGNRGCCAQPCRLPYSVYQEDLTQKGRLKKINHVPYVLSPKDLCTIEHLDKLSQAGVASLKIEGRMKSPEYVAIVTGIYRKYLDLYKEKGNYTVEDKDMEALLQIFNRGGFTEGYLFSNPGKDLMSGMLPKHQGVYLGSVGQVLKQKRNKGKGASLITIKLEKNLSMGDIIEVRNKNLTSATVTYMEKGKSHLKKASAGDVVTVGDIKGEVTEGDKIYKIIDQELMTRGKNSYMVKSSKEEKNLKKIDIEFEFSATIGLPATLIAFDEDGNRVTEASVDIVDKAINKPLTKQVIEGQLAKTGGTPFRVKSIRVVMDDDVALPLSKINELRRRTLEKMKEVRLTPSKEGKIANERIPDVQVVRPNKEQEKKEELVPAKEKISLYLWDMEELDKNEISVDRIYLPYDQVASKEIGKDKEKPKIVPVIPNITKGWHDNYIRRNFDRIVDAAKVNGIAVGNLGWIEPFAAAGVDVYGDYGLNLYNSKDFYLAGELGLKEALVSHEVTVEEICEMDFHGIIPEVAIGGPIPVMISEHCFIGDLEVCPKENLGKGGKTRDSNSCVKTRYYLKDRKDELFPIRVDPKTCQSIIFSFKDIQNNKIKNILKQNGINHFRIYGQ